jgi:hypothetical protein
VAATDQQLLDAARDSLLRILGADVSEVSQQSKRARMLEIDRLQSLIETYERRLANESRPVFRPVY